MSVIYAGLLFIAATLITSSVGLILLATLILSQYPSVLATQAMLAFIAMLYPLGGFLADVWCG